MNAFDPRTMNATISPATDIISVNPGKMTLGALHPEATEKLIRSSAKMLSTPATTKNGFLNFVFASSTPGVGRFGSYMLICRLLFSALLIVSGAFILSGEINAPAVPFIPFYFAIAELVAGSMIGLGLLTRIASFSCGLLFAYLSVMSILSGIFDMTNLILTFSCVAFAMFGGGKFSVDFLIRKGLINHAIRKRQKMEQNRLSYKAYRYGFN